MKLLLSMFVFVFCASSEAQMVQPRGVGTPPPALPGVSNGLGFEAKLVSTLKTPGRNEGVGVLASKETREIKSTLELRARNLSTAPADVSLEWYFIARDVQTKRNYVWDMGRRDLSLPNGAEKVETVESAELARSTTKTAQIGVLPNSSGRYVPNLTSSSKESGSRPIGWIVRMWAGDRLVQIRASSSDLETIGRGYTRVPKS